MPVTTEIENEVGLIVIDNPPVNALSHETAAGIQAALEQLESSAEVRAILITANGRTFVAGADVRQFQKMIEEGDTSQGAGLYDLTNQIEASSKPVVCALFGTTLGGGLELAMACHYRIALAGSVIGQPEVKLGLIPGAGGTQRLPRLCGLVRAAELCGFGEPIDVAIAKEWGIIDEVVERDLREAAIQYSISVSALGPRPTGQRDENLENSPEIRGKVNEIRLASVEKYQGAMASFHAVDAVEKAGELSFEDGLAIENELFVKSLSSEEARNLIYLFFAERQAAKIPAIKEQKEFLPANRAGFPGLFSDDVGLLESLIKADISLRIVETEKLQTADVDFLFMREVPENMKQDPAATSQSLIVVDTSETFYPHKIGELGFDPSNIVGLRFWPGKAGFAEIGVSEFTSPFTIKSVIELLKKLKCSYVLERPSPYYASTRIREHRYDENDLKIEVWKLLQEKNIDRASDVDLIQVHCFGQPRHKSVVGMESP